MKKARIKKQEQKKKIEQVKDEYSFKKLFTILIVLVLVFTVFYFITTLVAKPKKQSTSNNDTAVVDSTKITMNQLLNRKENEYYVIATKASLYDKKTNYIDIYNKYISDYKKVEESIPVYTINLDDALNKAYIGDTTNISDSLEEIKISDEILFRIKNGKVKEYFVGNEDIVSEFSNVTNKNYNE